MLLREQILEEDNRILRQKSFKVSLPLDEKDENTIKDMVDYLRISQDEELNKKHNFRPAIGISAVQFGYLKTMFAIRLEAIKDDMVQTIELALINPKIVSYEGLCYLDRGEGCLNVERETEGIVIRSDNIKVEGYDWISKKNVCFQAEGLLSIAIQHEYDHLEGILFVDKIVSENNLKNLKNIRCIQSRSIIKYL